MAFRRRFGKRGGTFRKGTREQLLWFRQELTATNTGPFGTKLTVNIFDPDAFQAGNVDERWTVRRIRVRYFVIEVVSVAGTTPCIINAAGISLFGKQETSADPTLAAATDQQADWLALDQNLATAAAGTNCFGSGEDAGEGSPFRFDVRAMRKVDNDQQLAVSFNQKGIDPANFTNPTVTRVTLHVDSSVLFQRTRR